MASRVVFLFIFISFLNAASLNGRGNDYDTIVVGLGAAGTAASSALAGAGRRVLALEAQGRVGGRVCTIPCGDDGVVELGAEWIHGTGGSPTYALALEHNVTIEPQQFSEDFATSNLKPVDMKLIGELMEIAMGSINEPPEVPTSLGDHISKTFLDYVAQHHPELRNDTAFVDEFFAFMDLVIGSYEGSDDWHNVTTQSNFRELKGNQNMSWGARGYKTLFEILLNTFNNGTGLPSLTTKLNTEVTQIVWPQDAAGKVTVKTKDGDEYTADSVIVTVSVGVLRDGHNTLFSPPLPQKKVSAIENISLGVVNKIVLFFSEPWWSQNAFYGFFWSPEDKQNVPEEDKWTTRILGVSPPMGCGKVLTLWTNGETARHIETLSEEVLMAKSMELLRRFLGTNFTITDPIGIKRTAWFSNPFTRGSYSFDNLLTPQNPDIRNDLASPLLDVSGKPRVLFAGEASNFYHFSTVHGAVNSGRREAARLIPNSNFDGLLSEGLVYSEVGDRESKRITM